MTSSLIGRQQQSRSFHCRPHKRLCQDIPAMCFVAKMLHVCSLCLCLSCTKKGRFHASLSDSLLFFAACCSAAVYGNISLVEMCLLTI